MEFRFMKHTADIKFQAFGENFEEALVSAVKATFSYICNDLEIKPNIKKELSITSRTKENLLYDFLDEFLFIMDTESLIFSKLANLNIREDNGNYLLSCLAYFDYAKNYDISGNIKSVTYSEMKIQEKKGKVMVQVVLDI